MAKEQRPAPADTITVPGSRFTSTTARRPPTVSRPGPSVSRPAVTESDAVCVQTDWRATNDTPHDRWTLGVVVVLACLLASFYGYFFVSMFWFESAFGRAFWPLGLPPALAPWPLP
jgi:hypothetical protein